MPAVDKGAVSRRGLLAGAGAVAAVLGTGSWNAAVAEPDAAAESVTVRPGDVRSDNLLRGNNFRFVGHPDETRVVSRPARWCERCQRR